MNTWSFSRLRSYRDCPAKFDFMYNEESVQELVPGFEFGSRLHEACEAYTNHCYKAKVSRDHEYAMVMAAGEDDPRLQRVLEWLADALTFRHDLVYADESVERWFEVPFPTQTVTCPECRGEGLVEMPHHHTDPPLPDRCEECLGTGEVIAEDADLFNGKIDLVQYDPVTKRWILCDYKSGFVADESDQPPRQLLVYALAWREVVGEPDAKFRLQICYPEINPIYEENLVEWYVGPKDLSWDWLELQVEQVKSATRFPANPGMHCAYCPFLTTVCPYRDRKIRPIDQLKTNAARLEMKQQREYHQAAYKRLLSQLQEDCRVRGPIETPKGLWGYSYPLGEVEYGLPSRRLNRDADMELYEALCNQMGMDGLDELTDWLLDEGLLKFDNAAIKKAAAKARPLSSEREPELIDRMVPYLVEKKAKPTLGIIKEDDDE